MHGTASPQKNHHFYTGVQSGQWGEVSQLLAFSFGTALTLETKTD